VTADAPSQRPERPGLEAAAPADGNAVEPRKRLHPLSPILHGAKSIAVIIVALSWQTLSQIGPERFALATVQLHTAAAASDARIPGLPPDEAARLRDRLTAMGEAQAAGL